MDKSPRKDGELQTLIGSIVSEVEGQLKDRSLITLGDESMSDVVDWISTRSKILDGVIGKGIPVGRIVEFFGPEATGKTTLGYHILAETQSRGGIAMMIDTEVSFESQRAKNLGVDVPNMLLTQSDTIEQVFRIIEITADKLRDKDPDCLLTILWDSVSATSTEAEQKSELGSSLFGIQARILSQGFRMFRRKFAKAKVTLIVISQVRHGMVQFGPIWEPTGGGMALKHHASVRLEMMPKRKLLQGTKVVGVEVRGRTVKNKVYAPYKECQIVMDFDKGIDSVATNFVTLCTREFFPKAGTRLEYKGKKLYASELEDYFRKNPLELDELIKDIKL